MLNYQRIKCIRQYLTKEATEILVLSLVTSHVIYNCSVGQAPEFRLQEKNLSKQTTNHKLRSSLNSESYCTGPSIKQKKQTKKTFNARSFSTIGPNIWNELPTHIKQSISIDNFISKLKIHLKRILRVILILTFVYIFEYNYVNTTVDRNAIKS